MKVLLKDDVKNLGIMGSIVDVAEGYGRNFLIPRNMAVEASTKNVKSFEHTKRIVLEKAKKVKNTAQDLAKKFSDLAVTIEAHAGADNKLFGSVTNMDIAEALSKQGFQIDKRKIILDETIKRVGKYNAHVKLHPEVTANISIDVRPSGSPEGSEASENLEEKK